MNETTPNGAHDRNGRDDQNGRDDLYKLYELYEQDQEDEQCEQNGHNGQNGHDEQYEQEAQNEPDEQDEESTTEPDLWTVSAGGFSVTADAFAVEAPDDPGKPHSIWFLSMMGAQTSLKAVWASLLNMPPKPAHLTPGADGLALNEEMYTCQIPANTIGTWTTRITRLANGMGWHAMTYTRMTEYGFEKDDFLLVIRPGEDPAEQHHRFLDRRVSLPLHHSWADWLWERGLENGEIQELRSLSIQAWRCVPEPLQLESDLSQAVAEGILTLDTSEAGEARDEYEAGEDDDTTERFREESDRESDGESEQEPDHEPN